MKIWRQILLALLSWKITLVKDLIFPGKYVLIRKSVKKLELISPYRIRKILAGLKSEKAAGWWGEREYAISLCTLQKGSRKHPRRIKLIQATVGKCNWSSQMQPLRVFWKISVLKLTNISGNHSLTTKRYFE